MLLIAVIMSRLLSPNDYGVFSLLYLFTGVASCFTDCGFSAALIQSSEITETDKSTVFWLNFIMGICVSVLLCISSPYIASFFNESKLVGLTIGLSINTVVAASTTVQQSLFVRDLNFKPLVQANVSGCVGGGAVGIFLAFNNFGVWSILGQTLSASILTAGFTWTASTWRPQFVFESASLAKFFRYGGFLFASSLIDTIYTRLYTVLIGKLFGPYTLGIYTRADQVQQLPSAAISGIISKVSFPLFSSFQSQPEKLESSFRQSILFVMYFNIPAMLGLFSTAERVMPILFGKEWTDSVAILQILAMAGLLYPLHIINLSALRAVGRSDLFFRLEIIKKVLGTSLLLICVGWGIMGVATSTVLISVLGFFLNSYYSKSILNFGAFKQIYACMPIALAAIVMAIGVYFIGRFPYFADSITLTLQISFGVAYWAAISFVLYIDGKFASLLKESAA